MPKLSWRVPSTLKISAQRKSFLRESYSEPESLGEYRNETDVWCSAGKLPGKAQQERVVRMHIT
jgi:hypothetical protein